MTIDDIKNYFGTGYRFSKMTGMSHSTWTNWMNKGCIPIESQVKVQKITQGKLKADLRHVEE